jgi:hypothetical protein
MQWLIWVIVAIIVIAVIAAVVAASTRRKQVQNRTRAGELREQAAAQATGLQQREAHARETEARAAEARAEADRKRAEAERLEAEARDRHETAAGYRDQHAENLRRADELDPDVDTQRDGYEPPAAAGTETAGTTDGHRVQDRLGGETTGPTGTTETASEHSHDATHEHTDDGTTVTHPDGSTETVTRSSGASGASGASEASGASGDDQAKGDPSDPRLEGGTHRA